MKNKIITSGAIIAVFLMVSSAIAVPAVNKKADVTGKKYEVNENTIEEELEKLLHKYENDLKEINNYIEKYYEKINKGGLEATTTLIKAKFFGILPLDLQSKYDNIVDEIRININKEIKSLSGGKNDYNAKIYYRFTWWYPFFEIEKIKHTIWIDHYWSEYLYDIAIPLGSSVLVTVIISIIIGASGGVLIPVASALASFILGYIGSEPLEDADNGNGLIIKWWDYPPLTQFTPPKDYYKIYSQ